MLADFAGSFTQGDLLCPAKTVHDANAGTPGVHLLTSEASYPSGLPDPANRLAGQRLRQAGGTAQQQSQTCVRIHVE